MVHLIQYRYVDYIASHICFVCATNIDMASKVPVRYAMYRYSSWAVSLIAHR